MTEHEVVVAVAHRWAEAREREVAAIVAWSNCRRARRATGGLDAMVAGTASRGIWYPAWGRHPAAFGISSAFGAPEAAAGEDQTAV